MKKTAKRSRKPAKKAKKALKSKSKSKILKSKSGVKSRKAKASVKPKVKKSSGKGLSVTELFRLKKEKEQMTANSNETWANKKEIPPQDNHAPEDAKGNSGRRSGFGGVRHH